MMKLQRVYKLTVTGRGQFPYDMLRYDACWPRMGEDAYAIPRPERKEGVREDHREIQLLSYKLPTVARWASFGWSCSYVEAT